MTFYRRELELADLVTMRLHPEERYYYYRGDSTLTLRVLFDEHANMFQFYFKTMPYVGALNHQTLSSTENYTTEQTDLLLTKAQRLFHSTYDEIWASSQTC